MSRGQAASLVVRPGQVRAAGRGRAASRGTPGAAPSTLAPVSTNEIHQSPLTLLVRRLVAVLGVLMLVAGVVLAVLSPAAYGGWVLVAFGLTLALLVWRQKQLTDDGLVLRRTSLRGKG